MTPKTATMSKAPAAALAILLLLAWACPALADDTYKFTPAISARETYDSSVNFMQKGDMETSATPSLRLDMQKERLNVWGQARASIYKYIRLNEFDRVDQNYDGGLQFNATEKITLDLKGSIVSDHAFTSSLAETGQLSNRASHQQYSVQPSATFSLNETNSLTLFYAFAKTVYDTRDYTDSVSHTVGGQWGYRLNERTQLLFQLSDTRMDTDNANFNNFSAMTGFDYFLAETVKARVLVGASSLDANYNSGIKRTSTDYSIDASVDWSLERLTTTASFLRDMTLGISGDDMVRDKMGLNFSYAAAERLQLALGGYVTLSKNNASSQAKQDNSWVEIQPMATYRLTENASLGLGYTYSASKDDVADILRTRNRIFLDFRMSF